MASTLRKQLKDPAFRAWMKKTPRKNRRPGYKNWRVFVQKKKNGPWARVDFHTYEEALAFLLPKIEDKTFYDGAIASKWWTFKPPKVRVKGSGSIKLHMPPGLDEPNAWWCPFCRRVTTFTWFKRHHNMKSYLCGQTKQCHICGAPMKWTRPTLWKW